MDPCTRAADGRTLDVQEGSMAGSDGMASVESRRRSRRLELRTTPAERDLIERAVAVTETDLTDFVVSNAVDAARRVLADRDRFELDAETHEQWERINARSTSPSCGAGARGGPSRRPASALARSSPSSPSKHRVPSRSVRRSSSAREAHRQSAGWPGGTRAGRAGAGGPRGQAAGGGGRGGGGHGNTRRGGAPGAVPWPHPSVGGLSGRAGQG